MKLVKKKQLRLWQLEHFGSGDAIDHFVTERHSFSDEEEFNISFSTSPDPAVVRKHRALLAEAMGVSEDRLFLPKQVHADHIVRVNAMTSHDLVADTDALITNDPTVCIGVMSADCVPILLYDKLHGAVGAVHAGWKGTVLHILQKTLHRMREEFGTEGKDVMAAIGPSVCQASYEVGDEVIQSVKQSFTNAAELLAPLENGKAKLDLWRANYVQLRHFGVQPEHIDIANTCTVIKNQNFFSARKGDSGRFAAGIKLLQPSVLDH